MIYLNNFVNTSLVLERFKKKLALMVSTLLSQQVEEVDEEAIGNKVLKPPDVQEGLRTSRAKEWNKFVQFAAAIPVTGREKEFLLSE